eukprot:171261_1
MNYKSVGILVLVACLVSTATATGASKEDLRFKGSGKRISDGVDLDSHGGGSCGGQCKCLCVEDFYRSMDPKRAMALNWRSGSMPASGSGKILHTRASVTWLVGDSASRESRIRV